MIGLRRENIGYLLWGGVGTGKSYFAGCIANALMEQEIAVRMTNFALILNELTASFEGRNEYIARFFRAPLLVLDDFGMERGTEYCLEQVYSVIDSPTEGMTFPHPKPDTPPSLVKKIGKTTYLVWAHFSETSTETMEDKIKRMLREEVRQMMADE